jgi:acetyl-CoA carboxylase carboxyl transferase subunit alpha
MRYLDFERPLQELDQKIADLQSMQETHRLDLEAEIKALRSKRNQILESIFAGLHPYQRIQLARHPDRPYLLDYVKLLMTDFYELHGDRHFGDDAAIVSGLACFRGQSVAVIGHQKGRNTQENIHRNFGMANPEGFRKAMRVMRLAERFRLPVISFIDSAGAYPGIGAEERGQHEAIANNLLEMSQLATPLVVVVTGEGGSGGALAIGVGNRVLIMENAYYAVCTPEACAAILFKDRSQAPDAVHYMRILAPDLLALGVIDDIIPEPLGGAHRNWEAAADKVGDYLERHLQQLQQLSREEIVRSRYEKFRRMGQFQEDTAEHPDVMPLPLQFQGSCCEATLSAPLRLNRDANQA